MCLAWVQTGQIISPNLNMFYQLGLTCPVEYIFYQLGLVCPVEYMMNGAIQELLRWAENVTLKAKSDIEDSSLVTAGLTELQKRLEAHQTDCQEFEHYASVANAIKVIECLAIGRK